jgi:hypothetical protein
MYGDDIIPKTRKAPVTGASGIDPRSHIIWQAADVRGNGPCKPAVIAMSMQIDQSGVTE